MHYLITIQTNHGKTGAKDDKPASDGDKMEFAFEILDGIPNPRITNMPQIRAYCYHYRTLNAHLSGCTHTQQLDIYYPYGIWYPRRIEVGVSEIPAYIGRRKKMPLSNNPTTLCEEWAVATAYKILTGQSLEYIIEVIESLDKPVKPEKKTKHVQRALEFAKGKFDMKLSTKLELEAEPV